MEINEGFYCTKCKKVCLDDDCECTRHLNIEDVEIDPELENLLDRVNSIDLLEEGE